MSPVEQRLVGEMREVVGAIMAKSIITLGVARSKVNFEQFQAGDEQRLLGELKKGLQLFIKEPERRELCLERIQRVLASVEPVQPTHDQVEIELLNESDIVKARGAGRDLCRDLGFTGALQIKVATAISELARNAIQYAGTGKVTIRSLTGRHAGIEVVVRDPGPGIADIELIMRGEFSSKSGMGIGLVGTKNLMDDFDVQTAPGEGTTVTVRKFLK